MRRPLLWLALVCHVVLATSYALLTPSFEGPDENSHYEYAQHLANAKALPLAPFLVAERGLPQSEGAPLAHHPPLYYTLLAAVLLARGTDDTVFGPLLNPQFAGTGPAQYLKFVHGGDERTPRSDGQHELLVLRLASVLLGLLSILCVHRLGLVVRPEQPQVADVAALLTACLPMWSFLHGVLNSDVLATTLSSAAVLTMAQLLRAGQPSLRRALTLGTLLGLALLTKLTTLFLLPLAGITFAVLVVRLPLHRRTLLGHAACTLLVAAAISGWWFWRNQQLYGDVLALGVHDASFPSIPPELRWPYFFGGFLPTVFPSLLGRFGWFSLPPHALVVWLGAAATIVALLGVVQLLAERSQRAWPQPLWLLLATCALVFAGTAQFNLTAPQPQGRLLFPAVGPAAVLFAAGLLRAGRSARLAAFARCFVVVPPAFAGLVFCLWFLPRFAVTLAAAPPHHASLVGDIVGAVAHPSLYWRGAVRPSATPPVLSWSGDGADDDAPCSLYAYDHAGRVWLATYEWGHGHLELKNGAALPTQAWELLPRGVDLLLKLRRVPDWSAGERLETMPTSAPLPFRRE